VQCCLQAYVTISVSVIIAAFSSVGANMTMDAVVCGDSTVAVVEKLLIVRFMNTS
jgi:hypothetical protein